MQTNNLKDLTSLVKGGEKVASFKPYLDRSIVSWTELDGTYNKIMNLYVDCIKTMKDTISDKLIDLYNRPLRFSDNITSEMIGKVNELMNVTGKSIKEIAKDFRNYLGYPCNFFRKEDGKVIPVDLDRIMAAYKAMKSKALVGKVEKILFK